MHALIDALRRLLLTAEFKIGVYVDSLDDRDRQLAGGRMLIAVWDARGSHRGSLRIGHEGDLTCADRTGTDRYLVFTHDNSLPFVCAHLERSIGTQIRRL